MDKFIIYALHHDDSDRIYVGQSAVGMVRPIRHGHEYSMKEFEHLPIVRWIRKLRAQGKDYKISVLEVLEKREELSPAEIFYIAYFRGLGMRLLNCTAGGEGRLGYKCSDETKAKISAKSKLYKATPETRAKQSLVLKNASPAHLAAMRSGMKGKKLSQKHREIISFHSRNQSPEKRTRISESLKGRIFSPEWKQKISEALRGQIIPEQVRVKMGHAGRRNWDHLTEDQKKERMQRCRAGRRKFSKIRINLLTQCQPRE
jgi:hypothetical protein